MDKQRAPGLLRSPRIHLAVFGSIVAFGGCFTLIKKVGAEVASDTSVAIPVIAVLLSTLFRVSCGRQRPARVALAALGSFIALKRDTCPATSTAVPADTCVNA